MLGLHCCLGFSLVASRGHSLVAVLRRIVVASLVAEHGLQGARAPGVAAPGSRARAQLLKGTWDLPGLGIKPVSSALAGGFFTTEPPGGSPRLGF